MNRFALLLAAAALTLGLTACGASGDTAALEKENAQLRQEVADLEEARRTLADENDLLTALNADLQAENNALNETAPSSGDEEANPIDRFFDGVDAGSSTAEMNLVANSWAAAWEAECRNAAEWLKGQLPRQEDQALVDAYVSAAAEQVSRMDSMAIYPIADLTVPQADRAASSGTLRGVLWAGAYQQIWKDTFYQLLYIAPDDAGGEDSAVSYQFLFDPETQQAALEAALAG